MSDQWGGQRESEAVRRLGARSRRVAIRRAAGPGRPRRQRRRRSRSRSTRCRPRARGSARTSRSSRRINPTPGGRCLGRGLGRRRRGDDRDGGPAHDQEEGLRGRRRPDARDRRRVRRRAVHAACPRRPRRRGLPRGDGRLQAPEGIPEEQHTWSTTLQKALERAADIPLEVARRSVYLMALAEETLTLGEPERGLGRAERRDLAARGGAVGPRERGHQRDHLPRQDAAAGAQRFRQLAAPPGTVAPARCERGVLHRVARLRVPAAGLALRGPAGQAPAVRIDAIVFDCRDAAPLARFWADGARLVGGALRRGGVGAAGRQRDHRPGGGPERHGRAAEAPICRCCSSPRCRRAR